jgi:hypothetical protein
MDKTLKRGSVTVTESSIVIAFSKDSPIEEPSKRVGYDLNEKSIVGSDGTVHDLSEVARLHTSTGLGVLGSTRGTLMTGVSERSSQVLEERRNA